MTQITPTQPPDYIEAHAVRWDVVQQVHTAAENAAQGTLAAACEFLLTIPVEGEAALPPTSTSNYPTDGDHQAIRR